MLALLAFAVQTPILLGDLDLGPIEQGWGVAHKNQSVDGAPLKIGGKLFETGVGTHAESIWLIDLKTAAEKFEAQVGVDDEVKGLGSVEFQVWTDEIKAFDSGLMKGGQTAKSLSVDLRKVKVLKLVVLDGGDDINYDHADWADAKITMAAGSSVKPRTIEAPAEPVIEMAKPDRVTPSINGPRVVGFSPGKPFLFRIPVSGERPFTFAYKDLPEGVSGDPLQGVLSGTATKAGRYNATIFVKNKRGLVQRTLTLVCDSHSLALTPPMGWNSWNVWGTSVDAAKVRAAADMFIETGLADYGYQYINIDDAWEGQRAPNGEITTNQKFGNMRMLSDYVHARGLRIGIYSSPGPKTCAGYEGSYQHEVQDAQTYADWGIDYLKYDWCSYGNIAKNDSLPELKKPYYTMRDALDRCGRDIVFSLCQYGMGDVYKWGKQVGGNLWRTTGDIGDSWSSMSSIGFDQSVRSPFASPGGWNDPDMLVVGYVGWGPSIRKTHLKPNEQVTHITLWSMLAAPLLIGCDMTRLDEFTRSLLMNPEVIDVDQDPLGKAAVRVSKVGETEIWSRPLFDGSIAVGLFNRGGASVRVTAKWSDLGIDGEFRVRDLWARKDLGSATGSYGMNVPTHGARLIRLRR